MVDIAQIGFAADTRDLDKANRSLDTLEKNTKQAQTAATSYTSQLEKVNRHLGMTSSATQQLVDGQKKSNQTQEEALRVLSKMAAALDKQEKELKENNKQLTEAERRMKKWKTSIDSANARMNAGVKSLFSLRNAFIAVAAAAGLRGVIRAFAQFEEQLVAVGKTTNIEGKQLQLLGDQIQELARVVPVSTTRLLDLASAAGQLGVTGNENILKFAETLGKLELATDVVGEEGARSLARLLTITRESIGDIDRLGAVITVLGNNFATTEAEIVKTSTFIAASTAAYGTSAKEVAALSAAMRALGQRAETSGSAIGVAMLEINEAIVRGNDNLQTLIRFTGMSQVELEKAFGAEPSKILLRFAEGLGKLSASAQSGVLEDFNLAGRESRRVIQSLAANTEVLRGTLAAADKEWSANEALNIEAAKAAETFSAQMVFLGNAVNEAAVDIGRELSPVLLEVVRNIRDFVQAASDSGKLKTFFADAADAAQVFLDKITLIARVLLGIGGAVKGAGAGFTVAGPKGAVLGGLAGGAAGFFAIDGLEALANSIGEGAQLLGDRIAELEARRVELEDALDKMSRGGRSKRVRNLRAQELAEVNAEIARLTEEMKSAEEVTQEVARETETLVEVTEELGEEVTQLTDAQKKLIKSGEDYSRELANQEKVLRLRLKGEEALADQLEDSLALEEKFKGLSRSRIDQLKAETESVRRLEQEYEQSGRIRSLEQEKELLRLRIEGQEDLADKLSREYEIRERMAGQSEENIEVVIRHREEVEALSDNYEDVKSITDTFTDALDKSLFEGESLLESFKNIALGTFRDIARNAIIRPIIQPIVGSVIGGGGSSSGAPFGAVGGGFGGGFGGTSSGGGGIFDIFSGGGGGITDIFSSLFGSGGSLTSAAPGIQDFIFSSLGQDLGLSSLGAGGFGPAAPTIFGNALDQFASPLGAIGSVAGNFLGDAIFGGSRSGSKATNASIGSSIGAIAGSFIPIPGGTFIGSFLGNALGGLFGANGGRPIGHTNINVGAGHRLVVGDTGTDNGADGSATISAATQVVQTINQVLDQLGLKAVATVGAEGIGQGDVDLPADPQSAINRFFQNIGSNATSDNQAINDFLRSGVTDLNAIAAGVTEIRNIDATIAKLREELDREIAEFDNPVDFAFSQVNAQFDRLVESANKFGIATSTIEEARNRELEIVKEQLLEPILAITGQLDGGTTNSLERALENINTQFKALIENADKLGVETSLLVDARDKLLELTQLQAENVVAGEVFGAASTLTSFISAQQLSADSSLSNPKRLDLAQAQFSRLADQFASGDLDVQGDLVSAAGNVLSLGREQFASTGGFAALENQVISTLTQLATDITSPEAIAERLATTLQTGLEAQLEEARLNRQTLEQGFQDVVAELSETRRAIREA